MPFDFLVTEVQCLFFNHSGRISHVFTRSCTVSFFLSEAPADLQTHLPNNVGHLLTLRLSSLASVLFATFSARLHVFLSFLAFRSAVICFSCGANPATCLGKQEQKGPSCQFSETKFNITLIMQLYLFIWKMKARCFH